MVSITPLGHRIPKEIDCMKLQSPEGKNIASLWCDIDSLTLLSTPDICIQA